MAAVIVVVAPPNEMPVMKVCSALVAKSDPGVPVKFVGSAEQLADMLAKASFTTAQWKISVNLHQIGDEGKFSRKAKPEPLFFRYAFGFLNV